MSPQIIDLTGRIFGTWTVRARAENGSWGQPRWRCVCGACGAERDVFGGTLRRGASRSCGCSGRAAAELRRQGKTDRAARKATRATAVMANLGKGMTMTAIAAKLGISVSQVSRIARVERRKIDSRGEA